MTSAIAGLEECLEQLAAGFEPPPRQTVSEWADQNRWLSSEASAGSEGDPVSLAIKRSATWWNCKILLVSTPTIKGASRIESWWLRSNQSSYWVPSPECEVYQVLVWPNLEWPDERAGRSAGCAGLRLRGPVRAGLDGFQVGRRG